MMDIKAIRKFIEEAAPIYDKTAPTVAEWLDDLYIRLGDDPRTVTVYEVMQCQMLRLEHGWEHPNYAANRHYKVMNILGKSTVGLAGF